MISIAHATGLKMASEIKKIIMPYAETVGKGNVLWPLRYALSGQDKSVDPFTICYVLGKDEVNARLISVCKRIDS